MKVYQSIILWALILGLTACDDEEVKTEQSTTSQTKAASKKKTVEVEKKTSFPSLAGSSLGMDVKNLLPILNAAIQGKVDGEAFAVAKCEDLKLKFPPRKGTVYAIALHDKYTLAEADKDGKVTLIRLPGVLVDALYDCSGTPPEFIVQKIAQACHLSRIPLCKPFQLLGTSSEASPRNGDRIAKKRGWGINMAGHYALRVSEDKDILYELRDW